MPLCALPTGCALVFRRLRDQSGHGHDEDHGEIATSCCSLVSLFRSYSRQLVGWGQEADLGVGESPCVGMQCGNSFCFFF